MKQLDLSITEAEAEAETEAADRVAIAAIWAIECAYSSGGDIYAIYATLDAAREAAREAANAAWVARRVAWRTGFEASCWEVAR